MRAHLFVEGGGLVTGCDDIVKARRAIVEEWIDIHGMYDDRESTAEASRCFRARNAKVQVGRIVPAGPDNWEGYTWFWRTGYKLGKPGVTTAVVWTN